MGILNQQIKISQAMASGRTIPGHAGSSYVMKNLAISQVRDISGRDSDLVSGYWGGSKQGRAGSMYPDNRTTLAAEDMVINTDGVESIKDSNTAAKIETQIEII